MWEIYRLTEHGLVANFLQACGCSAEGPHPDCVEGQALWQAMSEDTAQYLAGTMTLFEADQSLTLWQEHLGA